MSEAVVAHERATATHSGTKDRPAARSDLRLASDSESFLYGADVTNPRRDSLRRRALAVADMVAILMAYAAVWVVAPLPSSASDDLLLLAVLPLWVVLNKILRLYDRDANLIHQSTLNELPKIFHSISLGTALVFLFGPLAPGIEMHRTQVILWWMAAMVFTPAFRYGARAAVRRAVEPERVLIIGSGVVASLVSRKLADHPEYGSSLVGYVDVADGPHVVDELEDLPCLGDVTEFEDVVRRHEVERVVIAFSSLAHEHLLDIIRMSKRMRVKISVVPRLFEVIGHNVEIDQIEGMTLLGVRGVGRTASTIWLKRSVDVIGAGLGLIVLSPLLLAVALLVKLDSPGPLFFGQPRVGRRNREFRMWKFRTMVVGADQMKSELEHLNEMPCGTMFKISDDPRVTRIGRFLRRASVDELPQLWNVLRGDMSLVGPRPLVPAEDDHVIGWHRARLDLTPGLTGPWQVMGRNAIPFHEMVKLDYLYVAEWSLWNDFKLMIRTLPVVLGRRGA